MIVSILLFGLLVNVETLLFKIVRTATNKKVLYHFLILVTILPRTVIYLSIRLVLATIFQLFTKYKLNTDQKSTGGW